MIKPSVYEGLYNVWYRAVESELIPRLRHYGISLYCFNPLAGGFLTGKFQRGQEGVETGGRFDPSRIQGQTPSRPLLVSFRLLELCNHSIFPGFYSRHSPCCELTA
jgi:aryl-alcohol dehydrogenase-like predicted oxidoreductase